MILWGKLVTQLKLVACLGVLISSSTLGQEPAAVTSLRQVVEIAEKNQRLESKYLQSLNDDAIQRLEDLLFDTSLNVDLAKLAELYQRISKLKGIPITERKAFDNLNQILQIRQNSQKFHELLYPPEPAKPAPKSPATPSTNPGASPAGKTPANPGAKTPANPAGTPPAAAPKKPTVPVNPGANPGPAKSGVPTPGANPPAANPNPPAANPNPPAANPNPAAANPNPPAANPNPPAANPNPPAANPNPPAANPNPPAANPNPPAANPNPANPKGTQARVGDLGVQVFKPVVYLPQETPTQTGTTAAQVPGPITPAAQEKVIQDKPVDAGAQAKAAGPSTAKPADSAGNPAKSVDPAQPALAPKNADAAVKPQLDPEKLEIEAKSIANLLRKDLEQLFDPQRGQTDSKFDYLRLRHALKKVQDDCSSMLEKKLIDDNSKAVR